MSAHTQVLYHLFETRLFTVGYHTAGLGVHTTGFGAPGQVEWFIPYLRSLQEGWADQAVANLNSVVITDAIRALG